MKRILFLGSLIIGIISLSTYQFLMKSHLHEATESFIKIPIFYLSLLKLPHIEIEIEKTKFSLLLDSGSDTELSFQEKALQKIKGKKFLTKSNYSNFKGNQYSTKVYHLDMLNLDKTLTLFNLEIRRDNEEAIKIGSRLNETPHFLSWIWDLIESWKSHGKIGNGILKNFVCYFDFPNKIFCLAKDLENLTKQGNYSFGQFISAPIEVAQFGPILTVKTQWGPKTFLLDTGSTRSLIHPKEASFKEETESDLFLENSLLGNCRFVFRNISPLFLGIDGILGVDFFRQNVVCIDYPRKTVYIFPSAREKSPTP